MNQIDKRLAYLILRLALGANMLFHGLSRLLGEYEKFVSGMGAQFASTFLPQWSVLAFGYVVPWLEAGIGILLLLGFLTRYVSLIGALVMINLIFGMSLLQKWEIVGLQMNYVFFYFLLLYLIEFNAYSIDGWRAKRAGSARIGSR